MNTLKKIAAAIASALSVFYLSNIGFGWVEIIPDNIPFAGNIDEVVVSFILLRCLLFLGIDPMALKKLAMRNVTPKKSPDKIPGGEQD